MFCDLTDPGLDNKSVLHESTRFLVVEKTYQLQYYHGHTSKIYKGDEPCIIYHYLNKEDIKIRTT